MTRTIRLQLVALHTDPHPYKPFSPRFATPEGEPVFVDFRLPPKGGTFRKLKDGGIILNDKSFQLLLKEVGRTIMDVQVSAVDG